MSESRKVLAFPAEVAKRFLADPRVVLVRVYEDGFVPRAYRWKAPGEGTEYRADGSVGTFKYDRKRSGGKGSRVVAYSAAGGVLR